MDIQQAQRCVWFETHIERLQWHQDQLAINLITVIFYMDEGYQTAKSEISR